MDRRTFLTACPALIVTASNLPGCTSSSGAEQATEAGPAYTPDELMSFFDSYTPCYQAALVSSATADKTIADARGDFGTISTMIPYIGPIQGKNPLPGTLVASGVALAYYRVLKGAGATTDQAGKVIVDAFNVGLDSNPADVLTSRGDYEFTDSWYAIQQSAAQQSQTRQYPGDWVYTFVPGGDATDFDWGLDFSECAILKFYRAMGAAEAVTFQCVQDLYASKAMGTGLARTKTLAAGGGCCDFRYKHGRDVTIPS